MFELFTVITFVESLLIKVETYRVCSCAVLALFMIAAHDASQLCQDS